MRTGLFLFLLTFVLGMSAFAAPSINAPDVLDQENRKADIRGDSFIWSSHGFDRKTYFHSYRQNLSLHLGGLVALKQEDEDESILKSVLGFAWELPRAFSPKWELGFSWVGMSLGLLALSHKHIDQEKEAFRPYFSYGLIHKVVPDERFSSFTNQENYLAKIGVGWESSRKPKESYRLDIDTAAGLEDFWIMLKLGYVWAW
jgi:hypothetical protein